MKRLLRKGKPRMCLAFPVWGVRCVSIFRYGRRICPGWGGVRWLWCFWKWIERNNVQQICLGRGFSSNGKTNRQTKCTAYNWQGCFAISYLKGLSKSIYRAVDAHTSYSAREIVLLHLYRQTLGCTHKQVLIVPTKLSYCIDVWTIHQSNNALHGDAPNKEKEKNKKRGLNGLLPNRESAPARQKKQPEPNFSKVAASTDAPGPFGWEWAITREKGWTRRGGCQSNSSKAGTPCRQASRNASISCCNLHSIGWHRGLFSVVYV